GRPRARADRRTHARDGRGRPCSLARRDASREDGMNPLTPLEWTLLGLTSIQAIVIVGGVMLRRRKADVQPGRELTVGEVEALAIEHASDPVVVALAMDWQRIHRTHQRDVRMLNLEL